MTEESRRLENVNAFIRKIGSCGRRFFYHERTDTFASMSLDERGRVWFTDDYTGKSIYTHYIRGRWKGFSHGGTLRELVCFFREHIKTGQQMSDKYFDPELEVGGARHWGYPGEAIGLLHEEGIRLGIIFDRKGLVDDKS